MDKEGQMNTNAAYLDLCYALKVPTLENVALHWKRNGRIGNYLMIERDGEVIEEVFEPQRLNKISELFRIVYGQKEDALLEDALWNS